MQNSEKKARCGYTQKKKTENLISLFKLIFFPGSPKAELFIRFRLCGVAIIGKRPRPVDVVVVMGLLLGVESLYRLIVCQDFVCFVYRYEFPVHILVTRMEIRMIQLAFRQVCLFDVGF